MICYDVYENINDGNEEVTVPEGFIGYIWLQIIVTGPENPMAHAMDTSVKIYDPIPVHMLDDEEDQEVMQQAVRDQINGTGESEFAELLLEPETQTEALVVEVQGSTTEETASTTDEAALESDTATSTEENLPEEEAPMATTTEKVVTENASTTQEATETATTSEEVFDRSSFERDINTLIDEFRSEYENTEPVEGSTEGGESTTTQPIATTTKEIEEYVE